MKYCPKCGRSYTDDVVFCYEDGTQLSSSFSGQDSPQNIQSNLVGFDKGSATPPTFPTLTVSSISPPSTVQQPRKNSLVWVIGTLAVIFFVFLTGLAGVGFYLLNRDSNTNSTATRTSANQTSANQSLNQPSTNKNSENLANKDNLANEDKLANEDDEEFVNSNPLIPQNTKSTESKEVKLDKSKEGREEDVLSDVKEDEEEREELIDKPVDLGISGKYSGVAVDQVGRSASFTLRLIQKGDSLEGSVIFRKPFVGSGPITVGYTDGKRVSFTTYNERYQITINWEGRITGNVIQGSYVASTPDPRFFPNPAYTKWRATKSRR